MPLVAIVFTLGVLLILTLYYLTWIKPQRVIKNYVKLLKQRGFKVLQYPYNPIRHDSLQTIQRGTKEGDVMKFYKTQRKQFDVIVSNSLNRPKLQFNHPDFIRDFYSVDKHYEYPREKKLASLIAWTTGRKQLSSNQGSQWKRKRAIFNKLFNYNFIKSKCQKITTITTKSIKQQQVISKRVENTFSYYIIELMTKVFAEVSLKIFLGGNKDQFINGEPAGLFFSKLMRKSMKEILKPLNYVLGVRFLDLALTDTQRQIKKQMIAYKTWALNFVAQRIKQIKLDFEKNKSKDMPSDIIQGIVMENLQARSQNSSHKQLSSQQIVDDFSSFFMAGVEPTAIFTQMLIYYVAIYPNIEQKVRKQVELYMQNDDYSYENLKKFTYIDMLQKQTTRYFGPSGYLFPRVAIVDNYINSLPIRKGTQITVMHMGNHFSQKYFKNPTEFRPQRWENQCDEIPQFAAGGFGGGARTCIGKHLALFESKIVLIKFLKRYKKIVLPKTQFKTASNLFIFPEEFEAKMIIDLKQKFD